MKKAKSILAAALAVIMAVCMIPSAAALEIGDTVIWTFDHIDETEYTYAGNLFATNTIGYSEDGQVYSYFPSESGYYSVKLEYGYFFAAETFSFDEGKAHEYREYIESSSKDEKVYYFEKDEAVAIGVSDCIGDSFLKIEYYGAEITDLLMANNALDNLIIDCDIPDDSAEFSLFEGATVVFDTGKTVKLETVDFEIADGSFVKEGENEVNAVIPGKKFARTMTAYDADEFVKDVTLTNSSEYTYIYEDFKGFYRGMEIIGEYINVEFTNGEGLVCPYNGGFRRADFSNGRSYYVFARYNNYEKTLEVGFSSEVNATGWHDNCYVVNSYECEVIEKDFDYNLAKLNEYNTDLANQILWHIGSISNMGYAAECFIGIFKNFAEFWAYVI